MTCLINSSLDEANDWSVCQCPAVTGTVLCESLGISLPKQLGSALRLNSALKETIAKSREGHSLNVSHPEEIQ